MARFTRLLLDSASLSHRINARLRIAPRLFTEDWLFASEWGATEPRARAGDRSRLQPSEAPRPIGTASSWSANAFPFAASCSGYSSRPAMMIRLCAAQNGNSSAMRPCSHHFAARRRGELQIAARSRSTCSAAAVTGRSPLERGEPDSPSSSGQEVDPNCTQLTATLGVRDFAPSAC